MSTDEADLPPREEAEEFYSRYELGEVIGVYVHLYYPMSVVRWEAHWLVIVAERHVIDAKLGKGEQQLCDIARWSRLVKNLL